MPGIIQLIKRLDKQRLKSINVIKPASSGSVHSRLYQAISNNAITDDLSVQKYLLDNLGNSTSVNMSKMRFKEKVLNLFFLQNSTEVLRNEQAQSKFKANKYLFFARTLSLIGAYEMSMQMAQKSIRISNKFKFYDLLYDALNQFLIIASRTGTDCEWDQYVVLLKEVREKRFHLDQAEIIYADLAYLKRVKKLGKYTENELLHILSDLKVNVNKANTQRSKQLYFLALSVVCQHTREFDLIYKESKSYYKELIASNKASKKDISVAILMNVEACLQLKKVDEGVSLVLKEGLPRVPDDTVNYLNFLELLFLLYMHSKKYSSALKVFEKAIVTRTYEILSDRNKEKWLIYESYLLYVVGVVLPESSSISKFKIGKFLNSLPNLSKDKRQFNVHIRVLEVLHLLKEQKLYAIIEGTEALELYSTRYMRRKESDVFSRSHQFVKALGVMAKTGFDYEDTLKKSDKYINRLHTIPYNMYDSNFYEIIPYEHLWELIGAQLKRAS